MTEILIHVKQGNNRRKPLLESYNLLIIYKIKVKRKNTLIRVIFLATGTDEKRHTLKNHIAPTVIVDMTEIFHIAIDKIHNTYKIHT